MHKLIEYLELVLTGAGVLVVIGAFAIFRDVEPWKAAAIAGLAVGVIHGIIFFMVRSAQRRTRNQAVHAIRHTFDDLVRNKLQVVLFATEIQNEDWRPAAQRAVQEIQNSLNRIEAESLRAAKSWHGEPVPLRGA
jgi:MFS superfamily sulfate permease-like transporter